MKLLILILLLMMSGCAIINPKAIQCEKVIDMKIYSGEDSNMLSFVYYGYKCQIK